MVDGREFYRCKDSWECHDLTRAVNQKFYAESRYGYTEGGCLAHIGDGLFFNRRVVYLKPDLVLIADEFYGRGAHDYSQFFHFNNVGQLTLTGDGCRYEGRRARADFVFPGGVRAKVIDSRLSRHYNEWERNQAVETAFSGDGFTCAYTVVGLSDADDTRALRVEKLPVRSTFKGTLFADSQIEAFNLRLGDLFYTVAVAHEEYASPTDTFEADGCVGFGQVVVFDRAQGEQKIGAVLQW
jgi:hypothetical protein